MRDKSFIDAPDTVMICYCGKVTKKMILDAVKDGHRAFEQIKEATGACPDDSDCARNNPSGRCCGPDIIALLKAVTFGTAGVFSGYSCPCCKKSV